MRRGKRGGGKESGDRGEGRKREEGGGGRGEGRRGKERWVMGERNSSRVRELCKRARGQGGEGAREQGGKEEYYYSNSHNGKGKLRVIRGVT